MGRHALVVGATGFIGREVLSQLLNKAESLSVSEISVVSRRSNLEGWLSEMAVGSAARKLHAVHWDLVNDSPESHSARLVGVTDVFYALQFPGHPVEDPERGLTYLRYDLGGLENLLCALGAGNGPVQSKPRRIIYISGAGAGRGLQEPWFLAKDRAEALLAEYARRTGGTYLALRPSLVFGARDVSLNRFLNIARRTGLLPLLGAGDVLLQPIWVRDLARAVLELGFANPSLSGAFDLPGPQKITFRELLSQLLQARGVRAVFLPTPMPLVSAMAWGLGHLPGQLLNPGAVRFLTTSVPMGLPTGPSETLRELFQEFAKQCKTPAEAFQLYGQVSEA